MTADFNPVEADAAATHSQMRFWELQILAGTSMAIPIAVELTGKLNLPALAAAVDATMGRYDTLRTCFQAAPNGLRQLTMREVDVPIRIVDLRHLPAGDSQALSSTALANAALRTIDMRLAPLLRILVFRLSATEHIVQLVIHHVLVDEPSINLLIDSIAAIYNKACLGQATVAPRTLPFRQVGSQSEIDPAAADGQRALEFWRTYLNGAPSRMAPAPDCHRKRRRNFHTDRVVRPFRRCTLAELDFALPAFATTRFGLFAAALGMLMSRLVDQQDVIMAVGITGRKRGQEEVLGPFLNTVVLRMQLDGARSLGAAAATASAQLGTILPYANMPFDVIYRQLRPHADPSSAAMAQVLLLYRTGSHAAHAMSDLHAAPLAIGAGISPYDLTFSIVVSAAGLVATCDYATDLYERATADAFLGQWEDILVRGIASPWKPIGALAPVTSSSPHTPLQTWLERLSRVAETQSSTRALIEISSGRSLTYHDLAQRSNEIAKGIILSGINMHSVVGLCLPRGIDLWAACIGIAKAGCAYVALPYREHQAASSKEIASQIAMLIADDAALAGFDFAPGNWLTVDALCAIAKTAPVPLVLPIPSPASLAYIMYTSGSTGKPKGVEVTHASLSATIDNFIGPRWFTRSTQLLSITDITFDIAALEVFGPLCAGGCVLIAPEGTAGDGWCLAALLSTTESNAMQGTPFSWSLLMEAGWRGSDSFLALCGGEAANLTLARQLAALPGGAVNLYGPTEATIWSSRGAFHGRAQGEFIGQALPGEALYVLDQVLDPTPAGGTGELFIGGAGLARGYRDDPVATALAFIPNPWGGCPGERMYRTGDRFHIDGAGHMTFRGRADHQVKIRGFRIELDGIARGLAEHPLVVDCIVACNENSARGHFLAAYVHLRGDTRAAIGALRQFARATLPTSSLPAAYIPVDAFCTTPNNKIDRQNLPPVEDRHFLQAYGSTPPSTPLEQAIAHIWAQEMGTVDIGIDDDFFALGGGSLDAIRIASRIATELDPTFTFSMFLDGPTVAQAASHVDTIKLVADVDMLIKPGARGRRVAVSPPLRALLQSDLSLPSSQQSTVHQQIRLSGPFCAEAFEAAILSIVARHDALRTSFGIAANGPYLKATPVEAIHTAVRHIDLSGQDATTITRSVTQFIARPFDLRCAPLFRVGLFRLAQNDHLLALCASHLVVDGWSLRLLLAEAAELYRSPEKINGVGAKQGRVQYADYVDWQNQWLATPGFAASLKSCLSRLLPPPPPTFVQRNEPDRRMDFVAFHADAGTVADLRSASKRLQCSIFTGVLCALFRTLWLYSGEPDLTIMTPAANRAQLGLQETIGMIMNPVILRYRVTAQSTEATMVQLANALRCALENQQVPLAVLNNALRLARGDAALPFTQTFVVWNEHVTPAFVLPKIETGSGFAPGATTDLEPLSPIPLNIDLTLGKDRLDVRLTHRLDYIDINGAARLAHLFQQELARLGKPD